MQEGSFNAPHLDSTRTNSRVHTVLFGVESNSASRLVVSGLPCPIVRHKAAALACMHIFHSS